MKYFIVAIALILPSICGAQQQQCVGYGCPPTQASVSDLIEASRHNSRTPGVSFAEGAATGFAQGVELRRQQEELRQIQEQREELRRSREELERAAKAQPTEAPAQTPAETYWDPTIVQGLMERCRNRNGYDEGISDGFFLAWMEANLVGKKRSFCFPAGTSVTLAQLKAVYIQWAENNPAKWHLSSISHLNESIKWAFPCPKAKIATSNWKDRAEKEAK